MIVGDRDMLGDDVPPCELNHAPRAGMHFGFPYCHGGAIPDPDFGKKRSCDEFVKPAQALRERDQVNIHRVQNQLDRHQDNDDIPARQHA